MHRHLFLLLCGLLLLHVASPVAFAEEAMGNVATWEGIPVPSKKVVKKLRNRLTIVGDEALFRLQANGDHDACLWGRRMSDEVKTYLILQFDLEEPGAPLELTGDFTVSWGPKDARQEQTWQAMELAEQDRGGDVVHDVLYVGVTHNPEWLSDKQESRAITPGMLWTILNAQDVRFRFSGERMVERKLERKKRDGMKDVLRYWAAIESGRFDFLGNQTTN